PSRRVASAATWREGVLSPPPAPAPADADSRWCERAAGRIPNSGHHPTRRSPAYSAWGVEPRIFGYAEYERGGRRAGGVTGGGGGGGGQGGGWGAEGPRSRGVRGGRYAPGWSPAAEEQRTRAAWSVDPYRTPMPTTPASRKKSESGPRTWKRSRAA